MRPASATLVLRMLRGMSCASPVARMVMSRRGRGQKWKPVIIAQYHKCRRGLGERGTTSERGDGGRDNHRKGGSPDKQPLPERHRAQSPRTTASVSVREGDTRRYVLL